MDTADDVFEASVSELLQLFRDALSALAPIASRAMLSWDGFDSHPDWERLAASAFHAFVASPVSTDRQRRAGDGPLAPYDIDLDSYAGASWVGVSEESSGSLALVRLVTRSDPFDSVEFARLDPVDGRIIETFVLPWVGLEWCLFRRSASGSVEVVSRVVAEE